MVRVPGITKPSSTFWDDLAQDLEDPELLRDYVRESIRIATIDQLVNALAEVAAALGMRVTLEPILPEEPDAWQVYELESRPDGSVGGVCATNDDEDRGCPGTFAIWSVHYANKHDALEATGGCHFGCFGDVKVSVLLDGVLVDREGKPVENWRP